MRAGVRATTTAAAAAAAVKYLCIVGILLYSAQSLSFTWRTHSLFISLSLGVVVKSGDLATLRRHFERLTCELRVYDCCQVFGIRNETNQKSKTLLLVLRCLSFHQLFARVSFRVHTKHAFTCTHTFVMGLC